MDDALELERNLFVQCYDSEDRAEGTGAFLRSALTDRITTEQENRK